MQAAQILSPHMARVSEVLEPVPGPDDVLIEIKRAGVCGTDLHIWEGSYAFAHYVTTPESVVHGIGDMSLAQAALIEPLACVAWGMKQIQIQAGDNVLIFGAGPMGCLLMQAYHAQSGVLDDAATLTVNFSFVYRTFHEFISVDTSCCNAMLVTFYNDSLPKSFALNTKGKNLKGGWSSVL